MSQPPPKLNRRRMLRYLLQGVALGAVAIVLVFVFTAREDTFRQLLSFPRYYLLLLFGMVVTAWLCNGTRVWMMCKAAGHRIQFRQAIVVSLSTEFGIAGTPAGVGGTIVRLSLLRQAGISFTTAGSLLAADAAIDVVFFALLSPVAVYVLLRDGLLQRLSNDPTETDALLALGGVIGSAVLLVLLLRSRHVHRLIARACRATAWGRRKRLAARHRMARMAFSRTVRRVVGSLVFLWQRRKLTLLVNLCVASLQWCCRYMVLPVVIWALGIPVNPLPLFLVQGVLFGISLLVVAPGGGGSVELLTAIILPNLVPTNLVAVVVVLWRFFTYHLYLLGGGLVFFYGIRHLHRLFPQPETADKDRADLDKLVS
ncbi:MAG: UPF0104 family protein [Verrucomicrobia bacterium]|nr:MAG: UPF0104 family protein [Verrucomicrobiota bacterium]